MSEAKPAPAEAQEKPSVRKNSLTLAILPLLILFAASVVLFWLSKEGKSFPLLTWENLVYLVAFFSLVSGFGQAFLRGETWMWYIIKQVIHWGGLLAVLYVINTQGFADSLSETQYTALVLYLLAFTTLLAAIHMDFKLLFFSIFLVFCAFLIAVPADNPSLIAIGQTFGVADPQNKPFEITLGVAVAGFIASLFVLFMMRGAVTSKRIAAKRKG